MSEPLSSEDIEDVVSSVRRLVSPEARPRPKSRDLGQDRLLLTPALRVVPEPAEPQPGAPEPVEPESVELEPLILNVPAAEAVNPKKGVAADLATPVVVSQPDDLSEAALQAVEGEWEDAFWSEEEPALAEMALGAEEAELVAVEEPVVTSPISEAEAAPWAQNESDWAEDEPVPFVHLHRAAAKAPESTETVKAEGVAVAEPEASDTLAEPAQAEPELAEPELAEPELAEPVLDEPVQPELAQPELAQPDSVQADPAQSAGGGWDDTGRSGLAASEMAQILTDQDGNPVTVLDEDGLSQIVRMLIREELQGVLGERITHNVRKLVRAEINRALTAQSLD